MGRVLHNSSRRGMSQLVEEAGVAIVWVFDRSASFAEHLHGFLFPAKPVSTVLRVMTGGVRHLGGERRPNGYAGRAVAAGEPVPGVPVGSFNRPV